MIVILLKFTLKSTHIVIPNSNGGMAVVHRCVGYYSEEDSPSRRLGRPLVFCRTESDCPLENGYARPVEGIHVLVDMRQMQV